MINKNLNRRQVLVLGSKFLAFIPMVGVIGCLPEQDSNLSPEDSLKKLIFVLGPWTVEDKLKREDFADRFLKTNHTVGQYLPTSAKLIQSLADRFPTDTRAIDTINLTKIPKAEKELLVVLGQQLYSFIEVRFYVSNEPSWGQCQGNSLWHTRVPKQM